MAYKSTAELDRRIDRLSTPSNSSNWGAILGDALKSYKANKLGKEREAIQEQNELNQQRELAMILRGQQTGRVGDSYASARADQFTPSDPALREMTAKMLMERATGSNRPANLQEWDEFSSWDPARQDAYLQMKRANPYINLGDRFIQPSLTNPNTVNSQFAAGVPPSNTPEIHGAQTAAEEAAKINAIPDRVAAETTAARAAEVPQAAARLGAQQRQATLVDSTIDQALAKASGWSTGVGAIMRGIPTTDAHDLSAILDTLEGNLSFDKLQEMRNNSPTGGALGSITERELALLASTFGSLKQTQSPDQFKQMLEQIREQVRAIVHGAEQRFQQTYEEQSGATPSIDSLLEKYR